MQMMLRKMYANCVNSIQCMRLPLYIPYTRNSPYRMFVSRTIAAEVCMEAKSNEVGYNALRQLDKSGDLRFELSYVFRTFCRDVMA